MVEHARAVIIGGGVGGTSIAYHLARRGWSDIILVERADITEESPEAVSETEAADATKEQG